jgi:hypothetical protein
VSSARTRVPLARGCRPSQRIRVSRRRSSSISIVRTPPVKPDRQLSVPDERVSRSACATQDAAKRWPRSAHRPESNVSCSHRRRSCSHNPNRTVPTTGVSRAFPDRPGPMTPSYAIRRSDPGVATGYEDESKRASSSSSRRAKRKSPSYKTSSSSSPISSRPRPEGVERGLWSQRSSTSASFADSTARRRRPISIASSEGGRSRASLRIARKAALRFPASRAVSDVNGRPSGGWRRVGVGASSALAAALTASPCGVVTLRADRTGSGTAGRSAPVWDRRCRKVRGHPGGTCRYALVAEKLGLQRGNGAWLPVLCVPLCLVCREGWRGVPVQSCDVLHLEGARQKMSGGTKCATRLRRFSAPSASSARRLPLIPFAFDLGSRGERMQSGMRGSIHVSAPRELNRFQPAFWSAARVFALPDRCRTTRRIAPSAGHEYPGRPRTAAAKIAVSAANTPPPRASDPTKSPV